MRAKCTDCGKLTEFAFDDAVADVRLCRKCQGKAKVGAKQRRALEKAITNLYQISDESIIDEVVSIRVRLVDLLERLEPTCLKT